MRKVCKRCRIFVDTGNCPICKGNQFSTNWQGRIFIADPLRSEIAKKLSITMQGEYAIKVK